MQKQRERDREREREKEKSINGKFTAKGENVLICHIYRVYFLPVNLNKSAGDFLLYLAFDSFRFAHLKRLQFIFSFCTTKVCP